MTTSSPAIPDSPLDPPAASSAALKASRPFAWSVRRELWENHSLYVAPLIAAGVVLFAFSISAIHLPHNRLAALALDPARQAVAIALPYDLAALAIVVTALIVGAFYCLGALHSERRDRSILFWKSLPVSDLTTVLSKAIVPLIVLPLIGFVVIVAVQLVMLAVSTAILVGSGIDASTTWTRLPLFQMWLVALYGLAVLALWYAPIWAWLLLVSGWARRAPFLWAVLPPLALCLIEKIAFDTSHFASLLSYRWWGFNEAFTVRMHGHALIDPVPQIDAGRFFSNPDLWTGLAFAAACLAAAVWLRRRREPI